MASVGSATRWSLAITCALASVAAAPAVAEPGARDQLAAASGEVRGLDVRGLALDELASLATVARDRGVTLAWPLGLDDVAVVDRLDRSGLLARVTSAAVACDACVRRLARARHAGALRTLSVAGCEADGLLVHHPCLWLARDAAAALATSRRLPALTALTVTARGPALAALVGGRLAARLRDLRVTTDAAGLASLGRASRLASLERLAVAAADTGAPAVTALVTSRHLRALHTLVFVASDSEAEQTLGRDAVPALAAAMRLPAVRTLDLGFAYVGDDALAALVAAPWLTQLERLSLVHTGLTDGGGGRALAQLAARGPWPALRSLALAEAARAYDEPWFASLAAFRPVLVDLDGWTASTRW